MRYRRLSADGDYVFGQTNNFLIDNAAAVAQAIRTRLLLWTEEWFLDLAEGTDYHGSILGYGTQGSRDAEIRERILGTPGVVQILQYSSRNVDRVFTVSGVVETIYSESASFSLNLTN